MKFARLNVRLPVCAVLAAGAIAAVAGGAEPAAAGRKITVTSGRCVGLSAFDAEQEAQRKADEELLARLGEWAQQLAGRKLSARQLWREQIWLMGQAEVNRHERSSVEEKSYGFVAEKTITLTVPETVLGRWAERLAEQQRWRRGATLVMLAATLVLWMLGLVMFVMFDRATGGYYRWALAAIMGLVLLAVSGLGWAWILLII